MITGNTAKRIQLSPLLETTEERSGTAREANKLLAILHEPITGDYTTKS